MAYGSPERLEDVPAYYADIRGGRPISPERLADLVERYRRLGIEDGSPLNAITEETRASLERELGISVFTGMKHWTPRIAEAVKRALETGASTIVGLVLAPHYSPLSIAGYRRQVEAALGDGAELAFIERWGTEPGFVDLLADRVRGTEAHVVFTAHSLPVEGAGDYEEQLLETSAAVAERSTRRQMVVLVPVRVADRVPWLGPDILDYLRTLHAEAWSTCSHARSASSPTTSRSRTSTSRPSSSRGSWASSSSGSRCRTPIPASSACSRVWSTGPCGTFESVIRPGEIRIDEVSRRFRVYPKDARTLKELIVTRGRGRGEDVWALSESRSPSSPARRWVWSAETAPARRRC